MREGPVAILASNLDGVADLAVKLAVAVRVAIEVAVRALHALLGVDILEFDRALPFVRGVIGNDCAILVEQIAFIVATATRSGRSIRARENRRSGRA